MSNELSNLQAPHGATHRRKHEGRGRASGKGKTAGRGTKGQKARKSGHVRPGFEGGQMPMARRLAKRGFKNPFALHFAEIWVEDLKRFAPNTRVDEAALRTIGLAKGQHDGIKILGNGGVDRPVTLVANRVSAKAKALIEAAGGTVELIPDRPKWEREDTRAKRRAAKKS